MYHYWAFGLHISSEIEFPELLLTEFEKADVHISVDTIPASIETISFETETYFHSVTETELLFEVKNVAKYYATNGNKIIVEINEQNKEMRSVRLFILATVMAAILLQRKLLPFHASAIIKDETLFLITGESGAGKSTTTAGLIKKGYTIFSDDVVVLEKKSANNVSATASYPMIKLWNDSIEKLEHELFDDKSFLVKPGLDKYGIFFHEQFDTNAYPIQKIFILKKREPDNIQCRQLTGAEAFKEASEQIYRPMLMHNNELRVLAFSILTTLLQTCTIYEIIRPLNGNIEDMLLQVEALM